MAEKPIFRPADAAARGWGALHARGKGHRASEPPSSANSPTVFRLSLLASIRMRKNAGIGFRRIRGLRRDYRPWQLRTGGGRLGRLNLDFSKTPEA